MFCYEGSIFVAGSAIQWLRDKLNFFNKSSEINDLYNNHNIHEKITFIPALTGLGAPYWNPSVRGAIFGLTRNTNAGDILKATIESIAFQTYDIIKCMEKDSGEKIREMRVDGGMVVNKNFIQFLSNILKINILCPKNIEITAIGVAYLAGLSSGIIKNTKEIDELWKFRNKFKPNELTRVRNMLINNWNYLIDKLIN